MVQRKTLQKSRRLAKTPQASTDVARNTALPCIDCGEGCPELNPCEEYQKWAREILRNIPDDPTLPELLSIWAMTRFGCEDFFELGCSEDACFTCAWHRRYTKKP